MQTITALGKEKTKQHKIKTQIKIKNTATVYLYTNNLEQDIGSLNFSSFSALTYLHMNGNELYGTVCYSNYPPSLQRLYVSSNDITDISDDSWDIYWAKNKLTNMGYHNYGSLDLQMSFDQFWERIPFFPSKFKVMSLSYSTFTSPSIMRWEYVYRRFENCTESSLEIYLHGMGWYGEIDLSYFPVTTRVLNIGLNDFYGDMSNISISHMTSLTYFYSYSNYNLAGSVDWEQFRPLTQLYYFYLNDMNSLTGTIDFSVFPDTMYYLFVYNNDFNGDVTNFGQMTALNRFYIHGNSLDGTIEWSEFELLDSLVYFYFYDNYLTGDVDLSYIDDNAALIYCWGYDNEFDGTITLGPIESSVQQIYLYDNPNFIGGVDFSTIASTSTEYPRIWIDEVIYCDPEEYCKNATCAIQQDRINPDSGYCSGKTACQATCVKCIEAGCPSIYPTNTPTHVPSPNPTDAPTRSPSHSPTKHPTPYPTDTPTFSPTPAPTSSPTPTPTDSPLIEGATDSQENGQSGSETSSGSTSSEENGFLSDRHFDLIIIGAVMVLICCVIGCVVCVMAWNKSQERKQIATMSEINRTKRNNGQLMMMGTNGLVMVNSNSNGGMMSTGNMQMVSTGVAGQVRPVAVVTNQAIGDTIIGRRCVVGENEGSRNGDGKDNDDLEIEYAGEDKMQVKMQGTVYVIRLKNGAWFFVRVCYFVFLIMFVVLWLIYLWCKKFETIVCFSFN